MIQSHSSSSSSSASSSSSPSSYSSSFTSFSHSLTHSSTTPSDGIQITQPTDSTIQSNQAFKRSKATQELLHTESIYSSDLIVIRDIYLYRSTGPPPSPPPLSLSDRQVIFSNISQIAHLAQLLASELIVANQENSIGHCFIQFLPRIEKLYTIYCSKYEFANKKLEKFHKKIRTKRKKLPFSSPTTNSSNHLYHHQQENESSGLNHEHPGLKYLKECKSLSQGRTSAWDLGSLLIKPVQRCLKYSLLLDQIIKFTESDHPDLQNLILARDGMINVADKINQAKRRNELVGEMITRTGPIGAIYPGGLLVGQQNGNNRNRWDPPAELSRLMNQVKRSTKALNRLPGDIRNSEYSVKNWILSADRLTEAFKATLLLRNSLDQASPPRFSNIDVSDLHRYQHLVLIGALNGPLKYLHDEIELQIIPKINELKELYTKPMTLIDKYEKRRRLMMSGGNNNKTSGDFISPRSSRSSSTQSTESNPNRTPPSTSHETSSTTSNKISELEEVENFLLDQLPKLVKCGTLSLDLILANLAHAFKLFHSDLTILINKVVFDT